MIRDEIDEQLLSWLETTQKVSVTPDGEISKHIYTVAIVSIGKAIWEIAAQLSDIAISLEKIRKHSYRLSGDQ